MTNVIIDRKKSTVFVGSNRKFTLSSARLSAVENYTGTKVLGGDIVEFAADSQAERDIVSLCTKGHAQ